MQPGHLAAGSDHARPADADRMVGADPLALTASDAEGVVHRRDPPFGVDAQGVGGAAPHALLASGAALGVNLDRGVVHTPDPTPQLEQLVHPGARNDAHVAAPITT